MRKYFLLSAVALLATSTANATTDYAEVTAKATIEVAGTFTCDPIDYGTIVVKQGNEEFTIYQSGESSSNDLISISGVSGGYCELSTDGVFMEDKELDDVVLKNENGDTITLIDLWMEGGSNSILHTLEIPADVKPGDYTGSFTITQTY